MKAVVVTVGCYSDAYVTKVFSSMEKFQEWAGEFQDHYSVEELDMDDMSEQRTVGYRTLHMEAISGKVVTYRPESPAMSKQNHDLATVRVHDDLWTNYYRHEGIVISASFLPEVSEEDATKAVADIRAQMFSNGMLGKRGTYNRTTLAPMEKK